MVKKDGSGRVIEEKDGKNVETKKKEIKEGKRRLDEAFKNLRRDSTPKNSSKLEKEADVKGKSQIDDSSAHKRWGNPKTTRKKEDYCTTKNCTVVRRRTEDNLPIYTMEELNIGKGGGTDLCPFDCNCCF